MLENDKGFYRLDGGVDFKLIVEMTDTLLTVGVLKPVETDEPVHEDIQTLLNHLATEKKPSGTPDPSYAGLLYEFDSVKYRYKGAVTLDLTDQVGEDEFVDFSRFEISLINGELTTWANKFIESRFDKAITGHRTRAKQWPRESIVFVWMPVNTGSLSDTRVILMTGAVEPIYLGATPSATDIDPNTIVAGGETYKQFYFSVDSPVGLQVNAGQSIDVPLQLLENADGSPLAAEVKLKVEECCGYSPKKRVTTAADGSAVLTLHALGLEAGDMIDVKLNAEHFTGLGRVRVNVV